MRNENCNIEDITGKSLPRDAQVLGYGSIILCEKGYVMLKIEFNYYKLIAGECITLFPTDIVQLIEISDDFSGKALNYSEGVLREASMHIEEIVYSSLRKDRICHYEAVIENVARPMFSILGYFLSVSDSKTIEEIATLQLKVFFLGYYDFFQRHPENRQGNTESQRTEELFTRFMELLEHEYMLSRDVQYYADRLFITRKYLGVIIHRKTEKTPKQMINEYVITQLKLRLRNTNDSIRQIASAFHFPDDSLMIRYFKSHTGMTPVQFRRNM